MTEIKISCHVPESAPSKADQEKIESYLKELKFCKVYDVLVEKAGAPPVLKDDFLTAHIDRTFPCREWRFAGSLGFGGKYRSETNTIDCYKEDETPERLNTIKETNKALNQPARI